MKKSYILSGFMGLSLGLSAQNCLITKDSISAGDGAGDKSIYTYNNQDKLIKVEYYSALSSTASNWDTLYYTGSLVDSVVNKYIDQNVTYNQAKTTLTYTSGKISRLVKEGNLSASQGTYWRSAWDIAYDVNHDCPTVKIKKTL